MSTKILVLEDDQLFNETLQDFLEEEGYALDAVMDPYSALDLTYENKYDIYLFDVNLPYESGFDLLDKLRSAGDMTPTIFLTSRDDKDSLVEGFSLGADDYMKKPIDFDELQVRIEALLRRQTRTQNVLIGEYTLDVKNKILYHRDKEVDLTIKVIELLMLFIQSKGDVVSNEFIKEQLWTANQMPSDGSIRVYVTQLKKLFPEYISNIRGVGYKFENIDA
ncbi:response regulator transcription factor [Sulfurovum sp. zt1-1]|uniref:Response regulator transcription factor n=1 Tax=Sulfurovum zhangzhouensis TaxID=3019067 RepID=A0ABT7QX98_9BACT|nr:response regulator transcription factor [Sulfurovum zhangzhouensis]MDM5271455.1 response regulator transcription factor [Sulfurovum zhangzhouensis]